MFSKTFFRERKRDEREWERENDDREWKWWVRKH